MKRHNKDFIVTEESSVRTSTSDTASDFPDKSQINVALAGRSLACIHNPIFPYRDVTYLSGDECVYYADIFQWKRNTPDIRLHHSHADGPLAGQSYFRWNCTRPQVGIGSEEASMTWLEMPRKGGFHPTQRFEWGGQTYVLSRVSSDECKAIGIDRKFGNNLKVVEEGHGRLVAMLVVETLGRKKRAELTFAEGVGEDLEVLIVLAITTWREQMRRGG